MKKILKKISAILCALVITLGSIGVKTEEISAAQKKYGGTSNISITYPRAIINGKITITTSHGTLSANGKSGKSITIKLKSSNLEKTKYNVKLKHTSTKNDKVKISVKYVTDTIPEYRKTLTTSKTIKTSNINSKKSYSITFSQHLMLRGEPNKVTIK